MLPREVMGVLALAILWVNTGLIAAAAYKQRRALAELLRGLRVERGKVASGGGPSGELAAFEVKQVGRLVEGDAPTIAFHDQAHTSRVFGGRVALHDAQYADVPASDRGEVWLDEATFGEAASCQGESAFDAGMLDAKKARGFGRVVVAPLRPGREVFVGSLSSKTEGERALVATFDPRAWLAKRIALASAFIAGEILVAAVCTAACLRRPAFGAVSMVGAGASLAFFLLVQPVGTWVRGLLLVPSRAMRRGTWTRPGGGEGSTSTAAAEAQKTQSERG